MEKAKATTASPQNHAITRRGTNAPLRITVIEFAFTLTTNPMVDPSSDPEALLPSPRQDARGRSSPLEVVMLKKMISAWRPWNLSSGGELPS